MPFRSTATRNTGFHTDSLALDSLRQAAKAARLAVANGTAEAGLKPCPDTTPGVQQKMSDTFSPKGEGNNLETLSLSQGAQGESVVAVQAGEARQGFLATFPVTL